MKKKNVMLLLLVITLVGVAVSFASYISRYNLGMVTQISIKDKAEGTVELRMNYLFASGGYSVRSLSTDEGEHTADGIKAYDGALGKHRILIKFGDVALANSVCSKRDENGIIQLSNEMRARVAMPSDHGFVLYVGCDKPISIEAIEGTKLNPLGGTIRIPITIENS